MSARERNRYMTTAVVFLTAFIVLGVLLLRSVRSVAQDFVWRPQTGISNVYDGDKASTDNIGLARDNNLNTAAITHTNADFEGAAPPAADFEWSGRWSAFEQTAFNLMNVGVYVLRENTSTSIDQWQIQYSTNGGSDWTTLEDSSTTNPLTPPYTVFSNLPDNTDVNGSLMVQTTTRRMDTLEGSLKIFDIRVEADWDQNAGGACQLSIDTPATLPYAIVGESYAETIDANCGKFVTSGYTWEEITSLPSWLTGSTVGTPSQDNPDYRITGTPVQNDIGTYKFTLKVTDESDIPQSVQRTFSLTVAGLAIDPPGPDLDPATKNAAYSKLFTPKGVNGSARWCLLGGSLPPGMRLTYLVGATPFDLPKCATSTAIYDGPLTLAGTPTNDGTYAFTIKLQDTANGEIAIHDYQLGVSSTGVTILKRMLQPMIKGITYAHGAATAQIEAQSIAAIRVTNSEYTTGVTWTATGLPTGLSLTDKTLDAQADVSRAYVTGTMGMSVPARDYTFTATIDDNSSDSDTEDFVLQVLGRNTTLVNGPPSSVRLPDDHKLTFTVIGEGGVPSESNDSGMNGNRFPYYNYTWTVTPVDEAPALGTASGTADGPAPNPPYEKGPLQIAITFQDGSSNPVTGTYDVTFQAQDYLSRANPSDPQYDFTPVTVRINVISSGTQAVDESRRPIKLRQEQFR